MFAIVNQVGLVVGFNQATFESVKYSFVECSSKEAVALRRKLTEGYVLKCVDGELVADVPYRSKSWDDIRNDRVAMFKDADAEVFKLMDHELITGSSNPEAFQSWAAYREALRDITDQEDPANINWPSRPA
jgi:hypothetical protein